MASRSVRRIERELDARARSLSGGEPIHPPHPSSPLAAFDAKAFPREVPSTLIVSGIFAAQSHLVGLRPLRKARVANQLTAWSMLRPALMAATQAGWVLTAPLVDGVAGADAMARRGAALTAEHLKREIQYCENLRKIDGAIVEERLGWLLEKRAELRQWASDTGLTPMRFEQTAMVAEVSQLLASEDAQLLLALWNSTSAAAHGYGWHVRGHTFGRGAQDIEGSDFKAFSVELDDEHYLGHVAMVTRLVEATHALAVALAAEPPGAADHDPPD